jgi:aryl-alcohol dehydrogenase-like predicted oxidoreductase
MRKVKIGDFEASAIGLGGWQFGGKEWGWDDAHRTEDHRIIRRAVELGINFIDTAEGYSKGESETIIGEALEGQPRDQLFVATKLMPIMPTPGRIVRAADADADHAHAGGSCARRTQVVSACAMRPWTFIKSTGPTRSCPSARR